jgi:ornithine cyclodeaminase/alanine dehydrogenase
MMTSSKLPKNSAGIKWAGGYLGERKKRGLPYITSMILLTNSQIGTFTAVMDGSLITNWRTEAQAAIALKYLRKNRSVKLGLYGAGKQGCTTTMPISTIFDIENINVIPPIETSNLRSREILKYCVCIVL